MMSGDAFSDTSSPGITRMTTWRLKAASAVVIGLVVLAVYSNTLTGQFLFDDHYSIVNNKSIRSVWPLSQSLWGPRDTPTAGRPLVNFSLALNYAFGQFDVVGYHLVNVFLHWLNAILLHALIFWTMARSSMKGWYRTHAWGIALVIALLWAVHPLQTESVAYVTQRSELLMALFFLATLYMARRGWDAEKRETRVAWQALSVATCSLGMTCKEVMVVAPVMVVLYDMAFLNNSSVNIIKRRWTLYLSLTATWTILAALLAMNPRGKSVGIGHEIGPLEYLAFQFWAITHYLWLAIWPANLSGDYGDFKPIAFGVWFPCFLLLAALAGFTGWAWIHKRHLGFLGSWLFLILAPSSSIIPIATEPVAERRMYLPLAAVIILLVVSAIELGRRWPFAFASRPSMLDSHRQRILSLFGIALVTAYSLTTYARNQVYRSELAFWTDVTQKHPMNSRAFNNLGMTYSSLKQPELAFASLTRAIEIEPADYSAQSNLGKWYGDREQFAEALIHFELAISANPQLPEPFLNRGFIYLRQGRLDDSVRSHLAAIDIDPTNSDAYDRLGAVYFMQGRFDEAIESFRTAIRLDARSVDPYANLGAALERKGEYLEAIRMYSKAVELDPKRSKAYQSLGGCFVVLGRTEEAVNAYLQCLAIVPNDAHVWHALGKVFIARGQLVEARQCFHRALQLQPGFSEAQSELQKLESK